MVLPEGDYVGLNSQEFDAALGADLGRADLFVQLLSPTPGRKARGFTAPLPQLQFHRATEARLPVLQWCERLPAVGEIADPAHAELFTTEFLRATHRTDFESTIVHHLRKQKELSERRSHRGP